MTAPHILANRHDEAVAKIEAHARNIAGEQPEIAEAVQRVRDTRGPDEEHIRVFRLEAIADMMEVIEVNLLGGDPEDLESLDGIGPEVAQRLKDSGIYTREDLKEADDDILLAVDGIGKASLKKIRSQL